MRGAQPALVIRRPRDGWGGIEEVATGLVFPTAMTFGPGRLLYVSDYGCAGRVVTVDVSAPLP
jgi:hypothetical protein